MVNGERVPGRFLGKGQPDLTKLEMKLDVKFQKNYGHFLLLLLLLLLRSW